MSYCRWSSDDWKSDIYCYFDCGGYYAIHVAGRRHVEELPPADHLFGVNLDEWFEAHKKQMAILENAHYEDIDLPHAGESFREKTAEECLKRLLELRELGYHVPESAIEGIREETNDKKTAQ